MNHIDETRELRTERVGPVYQLVSDGSTPIGEIGLKPRTLRCLTEEGFDTLDDLEGVDDAYFLAIETFGAGCLADLQDCVGRQTPRAKSDSAVVRPSTPLAVESLMLLAAEAANRPDLEVATLGDLAAAILNSETDGWIQRDLLGSLAGMSVEELTTQELRTRMDWRAQMSQQHRIDERDAEILLRHSPLQSGGPETREQIGGSLSITGERTRQREAEASKRALSIPCVRAAAEHLSALLGDFGPESRVEQAGFSTDADETLMLASVIVASDLSNGSRKVATEDVAGETWVGWKDALPPLATLVKVLKEANPNVLSLVELVDRFASQYGWLDDMTRARDVVDWLVETNGEYFRRFDGNVAYWKGPLASKAQIFLELSGCPATDEEIATVVSPSNVRSVSGALSNARLAGHLVRTADRKWALPKWGLEEYVQGEELIVQLIGQLGGRPSLRRLIAEVGDRFARNSVTLWASTSPRFVLEDSYVRLRAEDEPIKLRAPINDARLYRHERDHLWSVIVAIDYDRMYQTSTVLPVAIAPLVPIEYEQKEVLDCNGTCVTVAWTSQVPTLQSSNGFRDVCLHLGAHTGDEILLTFPGDGRLDAKLVPNTRMQRKPLEIVRRHIGGSGTEDLIADVAYAVGFDGTIDRDFTTDEVVERLRARGHTDFNNALFEIHPELGD